VTEGQAGHVIWGATQGLATSLDRSLMHLCNISFSLTGQRRERQDPGHAQVLVQGRLGQLVAPTHLSLQPPALVGRGHGAPCPSLLCATVHIRCWCHAAGTSPRLVTAAPPQHSTLRLSTLRHTRHMCADWTHLGLRLPPPFHPPAGRQPERQGAGGRAAGGHRPVGHQPAGGGAHQGGGKAGWLVGWSVGRGAQRGRPGRRGVGLPAVDCTANSTVNNLRPPAPLSQPTRTCTGAWQPAATCSPRG
jgi:hypothetical protein